MSTPCTCVACPDGVPDQWKITLSGVSNGTCGSCGALNSDYVLSKTTPCRWLLQLGTTHCGEFAFILDLTYDSASNKSTATLEFQWYSGQRHLTWSASWLGSCMSDHTLAYQGETGNPFWTPITTQCHNWPSAITIHPVAPALNSTTILDYEDCLDALLKGCGEGIRAKILSAPS